MNSITEKLPVSQKIPPFGTGSLPFIVPAVVLLLPAAVTQLAHQHSGEGFVVPQRRIPEPFLLSGFGYQFATSVVVLCQFLLGRPANRCGTGQLG
jgi:hypothetical protein